MGEAFAEKMEGDDRNEDREARERGYVGRFDQNLFAENQKLPPGRSSRRNADAEERERGLGGDRAGDPESRAHEQGGENIRPKVEEEDAPVTKAESMRCFWVAPGTSGHGTTVSFG